MASILKPSIRVRAIKPDFAQNERIYWFDDNPFTTHMVNALSFQFPPGEAMFVKSVMHFRDKINEPELRKAIRAFAAQESLHSKAHEEFNRWIARSVPHSSVYCEQIAQQISKLYQQHEKDPVRALAITVALEHLTAIMARTFLRRTDILEEIEPQVRGLLIWHAIEEIEHRAVAFDVFQAAGGTYFQRVRALALSTIGLFISTAYYQCRLLAHDGELLNLRAFAKSLWKNFGPRGFFTSLLGAYLDYYRRDFHPLQHADDALVEHWSQKLKELVPLQIMSKGDGGTEEESGRTA